MKKYLVEPYSEQTFSMNIGLNLNNTSEVTRGATYSFALQDKNPLGDSSALQGGLDTNMRDSNSQVGSFVLVNGQTESPTTTYTSKYMKNYNATNILYPIGSDNTPTTKTYRKAPTESPLVYPTTTNNNLTYFIIAIVIILIIFISVYFFVL